MSVLTGNVIAAVRTDAEFDKALASKADVVFDLAPDLMTISKKLKKAHDVGKKLFIHMDLASGIGKDKSGIVFARHIGVDGIISTRVNIIKLARENGLFTVQRFFIVDSHSIDTTIDAIKASKADMVEIMPGIVYKVIENLHNRIDTPIIAGGLIENGLEVATALNAGAAAVSTGNEQLWEGI